jgi:Domain of unknown function (DUF5668)/Cell wall-active antibiotics response 4TMS YvqF
VFDGRRPSAHFLVGVIIIALGFILLLDQIGVVDADMLFSLFWPLVLIYLGVRKLNSNKSMTGSYWGGSFWGAFLVLLGAVFLLESLSYGRIHFDTVWPASLIFIGALLIMQRYQSRRFPPNYPPPGPPGPPPSAPPPSGTPGMPNNDPNNGPNYAPSDVPSQVPGTAPNYGATNVPPSGAGPQTQPNFAGDPERPSSSWDQPKTAANNAPSFGARPQTHSNFAGGSDPNSRNWEQWGKKIEDHVHDFSDRMHDAGNWYNSTEPRLNDVNIFWGGRRRIVSKTFTGGEIVTIFGGFDLDLREADIQGDTAQIEVVTIFGGGDIRVPTNWNVVLETVGIFGGCGDRTLHPDQPNRAAAAPSNPSSPPIKTIIIKGVAIFGGVNIKN